MTKHSGNLWHLVFIVISQILELDISLLNKLTKLWLRSSFQSSGSVEMAVGTLDTEL